MPARKEPTGDDERRERIHERDEGEHHGGRDRDHDEHDGDDPLRHSSIIQQRWRGGAPPTAQRLASALQQWQALPGAVVTSATYLRGAEAAKARANEDIER
jgi:hypothetical protein